MRCYCVLHHGQALELVERPIPEPQGTEVLLKVRAAGVCHTDLHLWEGHYDLGGGKKLTLAERGIKPPITLSHEIVGEVVSAGAQAGTVAAGRVALVHPWIGCGECAACKRGEENICIKPQSLGVVRPGGFAEYVIVPHPRYLVDIEGLDAAQAAPLACAGVTTYSALKKLGPRIATDPVVEDPVAFAMEKHLEDFLVKNWAQTELAQDFKIYEEDGELVGQQYGTDAGPIDILAVSKDGQRLLVVELKRGRASDVVVGQILRYMGYVKEQIAEPHQTVEGAIIALDDDQKLRWAIAVVPSIRFYRYQVSFKLIKH